MTRLGETITCARCGHPVVRTAYNQKYCSSCGDAVRREKVVERNRSKHAQVRANFRWNDSWAARRIAERMAERARALCCGAKDPPTYVYPRILRGGEVVVVGVRGQPCCALGDLVDRRLSMGAAR